MLVFAGSAAAPPVRLAEKQNLRLVDQSEPCTPATLAEKQKISDDHWMESQAENAVATLAEKLKFSDGIGFIVRRHLFAEKLAEKGEVLRH